MAWFLWITTVYEDKIRYQDQHQLEQCQNYMSSQHLDCSFCNKLETIDHFFIGEKSCKIKILESGYRTKFSRLGNCTDLKNNEQSAKHFNVISWLTSIISRIQKWILWFLHDSPHFFYVLSKINVIHLVVNDQFARNRLLAE